MTFHRKLTAADVSARSTNLVAVQTFLSKHGTALANAADMLGGADASGRVFFLIAAVRGAERLSRSQCWQLVDLYKLLTLEHVGDPDRIETALFSQIDLESSVVHEICLLTEALEALLCQISEADYAGSLLFRDHMASNADAA